MLHGNDPEINEEMLTGTEARNKMLVEMCFSGVPMYYLLASRADWDRSTPCNIRFRVCKVCNGMVFIEPDSLGNDVKHHALTHAPEPPRMDRRIG